MVYGRGKMLETIDTSLRLISIGASLLMLVLIVAGRIRPTLKLPLVGLLLGSMAYLINSSDAMRSVWAPFSMFDLPSLLIPFWIWLFARRLFEREPDDRMMWGIAGIMVASWYFGNFQPWTRPVGFYTVHIAGLLLVVDLMRIALADRADDLIEKRRLIRLWLPMLVAVQSGGILMVEMIQGSPINNDALQLLTAGLIFCLTLFSGLALLQPDADLLMLHGRPQQFTAPANTLSVSDQVLKEKLDEAMEQGHYRTAGLTISGLASHLDVPEHKLRALINRGLGHRNFSAFLNQLRITEARHILGDKEQVDLPILTIAMDLGYNSLPTFNRAFRSEAGTTPSEYRRDALSPERSDA